MPRGSSENRNLLPGNACKLRLIALSLLLFIVQARAEVYSQKNVMLTVKNATIQQVFQSLKQQSGFDFFYSSRVVEKARAVTTSFHDIPLEAALNICLKDQPLSYNIVGKTVIVQVKDETPAAEAVLFKDISGTVTDSDGKALEGVTVQVKGRQGGVVTDGNGNFTLTVQDNQVLVITYIGYKAQEVRVKGQSSIKIILEKEVSPLDQVVVVGYGNLQRKDVTGSITSVKADDMNKGVVRDPVLALQGKVPGLNITKDGSPYGGASIILRGVSTLRSGAAQQPLIVVDGLPNGIMPAMDDVASIDILKDASATAIYGSRGANGVIIITTKKGKAGLKTISYNAFVALETISNKIDMLSAAEYRNYVSKNGLSINPGDEHNANTNWQDEITKNGISYRNNLALSGEQNKTRYYFSLEHFRNEGIIRKTNLDRLNMRGLVEQTALNDKLKIQFMFAGVSSTAKRLIDQGQVLWYSLVHQPTRAVKGANGEFLERETDPLNPVALIEQHKNDGTSKTMLGNIRAELKILPGLDYTVNASMNTTQNTNSVYYSKKSRLRQGSNGEAIRNAYDSKSKLFESFLSFRKKIGQHYLGLLAGYSWQEDRYGDGFQSSNINFVSDDVGYYNLDMGSGGNGYVVDYGTAAMKTLRLISGYARVNYEFNNKYLLQAAIRRDGSSAFGMNNRWGSFPSVSAGWKLGEEGFVKKTHLFDDLKLRVGYGVSGNSLEFDPLISLMRYGTSGTFYNAGSYIAGITPTQNENPDLKWERTAMLNAGIDFSLLKGRLSGTIEYYNKKTTDLIWTYSVPATSYYVNTLLANVGEMENKGWEFVLSAVPVQTKTLNWTSSFNASFNRNKILSLTNDRYKLDYIDYYGVGKHGQSGNYAFRMQAGYPVGQFNLWPYLGGNANGISQFLSKADTPTINPSSLDRRVTKANAQPKAMLGWSNRIGYRNLSLEFLLRGVFGNTILNATRADLNYPTEILRYNVSKEALNEPINNTRANFTSTRYLEKGDYVRMDNITLSYTPRIPSNVIRMLRVYATVNNAFVITKYSGIDPEVNLGGLNPGIDDSNIYPRTKSYVLGINLEF